MNKPPIEEYLHANGRLILDGAMGTLRLKHGNSFDALKAHIEYIEAGAQIITADTVALTAKAVEQYSAKKSNNLAEECRQRVMCATRAAARFADRPIWVAAAIGPTGSRHKGEEQTSASRIADAAAMLAITSAESGADILLMETATDAEETQLMLDAVRSAMPTIPIVLSTAITAADLNGMVEDFARIAANYKASAVGMNCVEATPTAFECLKTLAARASLPAVFYPSVRPDTTPDEFAASLKPLLSEKFPLIVGGCCGTTPKHIQALQDVIENTGKTPLTDLKFR